MPQLLALDWDERELRYVLATTDGRQLTVRRAAAISLAPTTESPDPLARLGDVLGDALGHQKRRRLSTVVVIGRGSVELVHLALPPARDEELPELVANQVLREVPTLGDQTVIDFFSIDASPHEPRRVTAAALAVQPFEQIQTQCAGAGLKATRIVLRPYAAASLLASTRSDSDRSQLVVNRVADEVDLSVLVEGRTVFSRTVRLPAALEGPKRADRLVSEIRRTLTVAQQDTVGEEAIEQITIFGRPGEHQALLDRIEHELGLAATVVDPFDAVDVDGELVMESPGPFAALLGSLVTEARGHVHAVDFLHPRKPAAPASRRRLVATCAAAVAAMALMASYYVWHTLAEADATNRQLALRLSELKTSAKQAAEQKELIDSIRGWQDRSVNWLDELRDLSLRFPPTRDALVLRMTLTSARGGGGAIELEGLVRDPLIVARMERDIRDEFHEVRSRRVQERVQEKAFSWLFETSMSVARRSQSQYQNPPPNQAKPEAGSESAEDISEEATQQDRP